MYKPNTWLRNYLFIPPPKKKKLTMAHLSLLVDKDRRPCLHGSLGGKLHVNVWRLSTQDQQVRMHYCVLIIIFTVDNFVMSLTPRPVEARPNRNAEKGSGVIGKGAASQRLPSMRSRRAMQALPVSSPSGSQAARKIRIFEHFWTSKITSEQFVRQVSVCEEIFCIIFQD